MANFTCDICGGTIKMQGSQGGVCQTCGMEYDIEAIRAKANAPQQAPTYQQPTSPYQQQAPAGFVQQPVMSQPTNQQGAIDRQALLIHLNDLRTMETILYESKEKKKDLDNKDSTYKKSVEQVQQDYMKIKNEADEINSQSENGYLSSNGHKSQNRVAIFMLVIGVFVTVFCLFIFPWKRNDTLINMLINLFFYLSVGFGIIITGIAMLVHEKKNVTYHNSEYKTKYEKINKSKVEKFAEKEKQEKWYDRWSKESREIRTEIITEEDYTKEMLKKAYDANIIPLQFRTIEGVYYLYDYLSTSNQTLAEALLQANLEAIKQRLDQVIESQGKLIVEQQQTNAKLASIQATNQQILQNAQRTAYNTAQAAQYAQIAATNTELLTKLNKKQLAYQRADFWLK